MNLESITSSQYLEAQYKARLSGEGSAEFNRLAAELEKLPATRQRLAFEFMDLALASLGKSVSGQWNLVLLATLFAVSIRDEHRAPFNQKLKAFAFQACKYCLESEIQCRPGDEVERAALVALSALHGQDPQMCGLVVHF